MMDDYPNEIILAAFKEEQTLQIYSKAYNRIHFIKEYPFTAFSGELGPKLKEGDRQIPEGYKVMSIPKETGVKLPDNGGSYIYKVQHKGNQVKIFTRFQIAKNVFTSEEYFYVKELFKKIIEAEKGMIEIKKI